MQCVSASAVTHQFLATTCWAHEQSSPVSTQYQLVSTSINRYQVVCLLKVSKSPHFK